MMKEIRTCFCNSQLLLLQRNTYFVMKNCLNTSSKAKVEGFDNPEAVKINNKLYKRDDLTNITPKILSHIGRNLHNQKYHPLNLLKERIIHHFYKTYVGRKGNPIFSLHDNLNPVVSNHQNFDSLLIPVDHPSRSKSDCYYINRDYIMRSHMTAHQEELIQTGLDSFLMLGDVYRRDEIDSTHYPVFHQLDAVRLFNQQQLTDLVRHDVVLFEDGIETEDKQAKHTLEAAQGVKHQLQSTLEALVRSLFGKDVESRWVPSYFPFTHPSWELEVLSEGNWLEMLGCGIIRQDILTHGGAGDRMGWAFGIGLERLAMRLYSIPDIRLFWSKDPGFLKQFHVSDPFKPIKYKPVSIFPPCPNDISFWLPTDTSSYHCNDFYELVREIGGDVIEQIQLIDEFKHPKTGRTSHCYRVVYRHMERTLTQEEVNNIHQKIMVEVADKLGVTVRDK